MKRKTVWGIGVLVAVLVIAAVFVALESRGGHKTSPNSTDSMQMSDKTSGNTGTKPVATDSVAISNFAFSPAAITVKTGTKVTWTNRDSAGHTVTSDTDVNGPASQTLAQGQSYSYTFTKPGTYTYHCAIHPDMKGRVVVMQ